MIILMSSLINLFLILLILLLTIVKSFLSLNSKILLYPQQILRLLNSIIQLAESLLSLLKIIVIYRAARSTLKIKAEIQFNMESRDWLTSATRKILNDSLSDLDTDRFSFSQIKSR